MPLAALLAHALPAAAVVAAAAFYFTRDAKPHLAAVAAPTTAARLRAAAAALAALVALVLLARGALLFSAGSPLDAVAADGATGGAPELGGVRGGGAPPATRPRAPELSRGAITTVATGYGNPPKCAHAPHAHCSPPAPDPRALRPHRPTPQI